MHELVLIPIILANAARAGRNDVEPSTEPDPSGIEATMNNGERLNGEMRFLYDVATRDNEGVVQNIDALDNGLIAIAVGIFAVALFAGDKWSGLEPTFRFVALTLLGESTIIALLGYFSTYLVKTTELVRVSELMVDFSQYPTDVIERAIRALIVSGRSNRRVRLRKRTLITAATALTFVLQFCASLAARSATPQLTSHILSGDDRMAPCHEGSRNSESVWRRSKVSACSSLAKPAPRTTTWAITGRAGRSFHRTMPWCSLSPILPSHHRASRSGSCLSVSRISGTGSP